MKRDLTINATGCTLVDRILKGIDFESSAIKPYLSKEVGDGGLTPGELVLKEHLEVFSGERLEEIIDKIESLHDIAEKNVGGPAIIALICAVQILEREPVSFNFFQHRGDDINGEYIHDQLKRYAPSIGTDNYTVVLGPTPETTVLSDPLFGGGVGERTFINTIGVADLYKSELLEHDFFRGDILLFGGTALTPSIHKSLNSLLRKGHLNGAINIVSTVFDFPNEHRAPGIKWPMGESISSYSMIDLLIADHVEALRLTGTDDIEAAIQQFHLWGLSALVVTNGAKNVRFYATKDSKIFQNCKESIIPVVEYVTTRIKKGFAQEGDTTGCGDNFVGGVLVSLARQMLKGENYLNLRDAVIFGNCTGASACFYPGGMLKEKKKGIKRRDVELILEKYLKELD